MKQKDEEWRRSQREWNKVWQDIEAKSFTKSLDYQSSLFKIVDKKQLTGRSLVAEIENVWREQGRDAGDGEAPRYQFDFGFRAPDVMRDVRKLVVRSVTDAGEDENVAATKERVNGFMRSFFGRFFLNSGEENGVDDEDEFESGAREGSPGSDMDTDDEGKGGGKSTGLRRGLMIKKLKESKEKSDGYVEEGKSGKSVYAFYANSQLYTLFRLYQV